MFAASDFAFGAGGGAATATDAAGWIEFAAFIAFFGTIAIFVWYYKDEPLRGTHALRDFYSVYVCQFFNSFNSSLLRVEDECPTMTTRQKLAAGIDSDRAHDRTKDLGLAGLLGKDYLKDHGTKAEKARLLQAINDALAAEAEAEA